MRLDDYPEREDAKRVWLNQTEANDEVGALIDEAQSPQQEIAFRLGAQAGLRREEIASVTANDFTHARRVPSCLERLREAREVSRDTDPRRTRQLGADDLLRPRSRRTDC